MRRRWGVGYFQKNAKKVLDFGGSAVLIWRHIFFERRDMYTTVLVSEANRERLNRLLGKVGTVLTLSSEEECLGVLARGGADFAVVVQHEDGRGVEFALKCAALSDATVVFVPVRALPKTLSDKLVRGGVCVLASVEDEAACETFFAQLAAVRAVYGALLRENAGLRRKVLEAQAVGRAKCLLVERRKMTEQAAHRFIEKTAMDNRLTRYAVAKDIIRGYERKGTSDNIGA